MSISCAGDFSSFVSSLKMANIDEINKTKRFHSIIKRINLDFRNLDSDTSYGFYAGSQARGTDIYTSDVDMVVVLPYEVYVKYNNYSSNGQSALLQEVKRSLLKTYSTTSLGADGQVIVINFSDGMKFEIVPAFINTDNKYIYPDSNNGGTWKIMNPKFEISEFNNMDKICNGNLKSLCKMMREWNKCNSVGLKGILIDSMAYHFLKDYQYKDKGPLYYDYMSRDFFEYLYNNYDRSYWSAFGSNWHVMNPMGFRNKAKDSFEKCKLAIQYANDDKEWSYKSSWRQIYGTKF